MHEVNFDLSELTLAVLEHELGPAIFKEPLGEASDLKWMLPGEPPFISASFLVFGRDVQASDVPSIITLNGFPMTSVSDIKVAGVRPGDSEEQVANHFEKLGKTPLIGYKRIRWDDDWEVQWLTARDKIASVICANQGLITRTWDKRKHGQKSPSV